MNGTVKTLLKGYGFIAGTDGIDYFFHAQDLQGVRFDTLKEGQAVVFEPGKGAKGPRAAEVSVA